MKLVAVVAAAMAMASSPVSSVQLPANLNLYSVQPEDAGLLLTGDTVVGGQCAFVRIAQSPLRVAAHGTTACSRNSARSIYPIVDHKPKSLSARVRIGRIDPRTHHLSEGPVVMTFEQSSDTQLEAVYGPNTLWLFDTATRHGAEVVEVSTKSGRVENIVHMPRIFRPVLAADDDGLWLAIAPNGGAGPGTSPIYRVASDAHAPVLVHRGGRAALWIVAAGHTVVADVLTGETRGEIWRFDVAPARARVLALADKLNQWATSLALDGSSIWTVREVPTNRKYFECKSLQVIKIDAATGKQSVTATVSTRNSPCYSATYSTFADGAFSFLYGNTLYRVAA